MSQMASKGYTSTIEKPSSHLLFLQQIGTLIVLGVVEVAHKLYPSPVRTTTETLAFHLGSGAHPSLIVTNGNGFVHVRPGTGNTVTVTTTKIGDIYGASPNDFKVSYTQSGNTITIQVRNVSIRPFDFSNASQADLDMTLPASSDLQIETDSRDIAVTGIQGKLALTSDSGALNATNVLLTHGSHMSTVSGSVTARGAIGVSGNYTFQSNSGVVDVSLPRSTSFRAFLVSNSGGITNAFPITTAHQPLADGRTVNADVGSSPQATVSMLSGSGAIHLRSL